MKPIKQKPLKIDEIMPNQIFDNKGYHCDFELANLKHDGNGVYELTIKGLGRSDKSVNKKGLPDQEHP